MYIYFVKLQKQRLQLLLMLLLGLICGSCLSRLLQLARHEFYSDSSASADSVELYTGSSSSREAAAALYNLRQASNYNPTKRILCMITVRPLKQKRQVHIEHTWGKRCHKLLFLNSKHKNKKPFFNLSMRRNHTSSSSSSSSSNSSSSWGRTREYLHYVYTHYHKQYDWFLMVTDETYVIMENLEHLLLDYLPEMPVYFDSFAYEFTKNHIRTGSGGNLFSKEALHRFVTLGHDNSTICSSHNYGIKHVEIARCFRNVGVAVGNSSDEQGLPLFVNKLTNITLGCCSKSAITFNCPDMFCFYIMEYIVYKLRPFGLS
ncbi:glycoprotein-N-acetylgalactosamine 3-beta-galactosyltransferase 1-like isoform X2 [Drosophila hydei]|uniref:N-acetylgalactosaminide beta-1,3-galactosyltransferase n=1 Tax=Drosophila hydei TaxID=7224 RepID=A0A6J1LUK2_DROHY|nr:glycoprotein-N-acetylgalactosamine 3-beta-galactosyltransferase 1-like isoform X2 [Drosophila hydei]